MFLLMSTFGGIDIEGPTAPVWNFESILGLTVLMQWEISNKKFAVQGFFLTKIECASEGIWTKLIEIGQNGDMNESIL